MTTDQVKQAMQGAKFGSLEPQERFRNVLALVKRAYINSGIKQGSEHMDEVIKSIAEAISSRFEALTVDEIHLATNEGALGNYGDFHGINAKTFVGWLNAYQASHVRKEVVRERCYIDPSHQLPAQEIDAEDFIESGVDLYREEGRKMKGASMFGRKLIALGKAPTDEEYKKQIWDSATKHMENRKLELFQEGGLANRALCKTVMSRESIQAQAYREIFYNYAEQKIFEG